MLIQTLSLISYLLACYSLLRRFRKLKQRPSGQGHGIGTTYMIGGSVLVPIHDGIDTVLIHLKQIEFYLLLSSQYFVYALSLPGIIEFIDNSATAPGPYQVL